MEEVQPIRDTKKIDAMKSIMKGESNYRDLLLFTLGINTGLRISDILALKWSSFINGGSRLLKAGDQLNVMEIKTKKVKTFVINKSVAEALKLYYDSLDSVSPEDPVFLSRKTAKGELKPITRIAAWQMLNRYANMVGLDEGIGTHTLRKTFGYHLYKKGVALEYIQKMLNHSSPAITLRYIGITQEQLNDIYVELNL
ncbi:MAG TPA: site-specific integrase [Mesotoga infera]|jgi:integrase|uniref:Putative integrase/recombinase YoeC n=1 Tax=Mesotoga infera TaxID=1236046 RepID=A0A7Z7LEG0_9BACT|nr:site-specific integrase [Mesotoga infera]SSC12564.1 putative integrase/recombinase YoeC [Mesotoga infera]SSC12579.1 putative integrase/recombinase YoeC [Mesotoga infera]HPD39005.1 site-specific integrase [Mesotoga infera]HRV01045.1 site-specific integrase [Mesotoga sp.]